MISIDRIDVRAINFALADLERRIVAVAAASAPAGANTSLSNLVAPLAIGADLLPDVNVNRAIGSPTLGWGDLYLGAAGGYTEVVGDGHHLNIFASNGGGGAYLLGFDGIGALDREIDWPDLEGTVAVYTAANVAHSAGDFTASGGGTWGVDAGDHASRHYLRIGPLLVYFFDITASDGGGAPGELRIALPSGLVAAADAHGTSILYQDAGGAWTHGQFFCPSGASYAALYKAAYAAWTTTAADNTAVRGSVSLRVQA